MCAIHTISAMSLRTGPCTPRPTHALTLSQQQCSEPTLALKLTEKWEDVRDPHITGRSMERASGVVSAGLQV